MKRQGSKEPLGLFLGAEAVGGVPARGSELAPAGDMAVCACQDLAALVTSLLRVFRSERSDESS